jgi:predicted small lipoprotein YifL
VTAKFPAPVRLSLLVAAALLAALSGCGKKGNLEPPPGEVSHFPRVYPHNAAAQPGAARPRPPEPIPQMPGEEPPNSLLLPQPAPPPLTGPTSTSP